MTEPETRARETAEEEPEEIPGRMWLTLGLFAAFVAIGGSCLVLGAL